MAVDDRDSHSRFSSQDRVNSSTGTMLRLGWMLAGNLLLVIFAVIISIGPSWTLTMKDMVYWVVLVSVIVLRYVDITRYAGQTAYGEPATRKHWTRYAIGMSAGATALWALAQSIQL